MDKIKENLFPISVGAIAVVLLAMIYFLVYSPLSELHSTEKSLNTQKGVIDKLANLPMVPTKKYIDYLEQQKLTDEQDVQEALASYNERTSKFREFFGGRPEAPSLSAFTGVLNDAISDKIRQYQSDFVPDAEIVDATNPQAGRPLVEIPPPLVEDDMPRLMREYWIFEEILDACTELQLGGLVSISYPLRLNPEKGDFYNWQQVLVEIHMPPSKLEDLLTKLFSSERVPFVMKDVIAKNIQTYAESFVEIVKRGKFANQNESESHPYEEVVPEPPVHVTLTLNALNWTGEVTETEEDEDPEF